MVPQRPFFHGRPGCVRSSAWIWHYYDTTGVPPSNLLRGAPFPSEWVPHFIGIRSKD